MPKYPPPRQDNYEKVKLDNWLNGQIDEVVEEKEHEFNYKGKTTVYPGIRLKFILEGYQYPHYSRWMKFPLGRKSNLFKKYVSSLIESPKPDSNIDIDCLQGLKIKTMWSEQTSQDGKVYQNIEMIRPLEAKLPWNPAWDVKGDVPTGDSPPPASDSPNPPDEAPAKEVDDSEVPF